MKIIIPTVILDFAETVFGKENIAPFESLPPLGQRTQNSMYIIYQENGNVFEPVIENTIPYSLEIKCEYGNMSFRTIFGEDRYVDPYYGEDRYVDPYYEETINNPNWIPEKYYEETFNLLTDNLIEIIQSLQTYTRLANIQLPSIKFSSAFLYKDIAITPGQVTKEHENLQKVTRAEIFRNHDEKTVEEILIQLGAQRGISEFGKDILYFTFPMYDTEKIKKRYSFTKQDLENLLSKSKLETLAKSTAYKNDKGERILIETKWTIENDYYYDYRCIYDKREDYEIYFDIEIPFTGNNRIKEFALRHVTEPLKESKIEKINNIENEKEVKYTIEVINSYMTLLIYYGKYKHKILAKFDIPKEMKDELNLDLSLQIAQALCSINVNKKNESPNYFPAIDINREDKKTHNKKRHKKQQIPVNTLF